MPVEAPTLPEADSLPVAGAARAPSLGGLRIASFYPWSTFEPTGAGSRFTSLWRFLVNEGAQVTLPCMEKGQAAHLSGVSVRYLGSENVLNNVGHVARKLVEGKAKSELREYSPAELTFLLLYEQDLYLSQPSAAAWLDEIVSSHDLVTCEYPMYAPLLSPFCRKHGKPLIVTSHDMLFEQHGRHPGAKERLKRKELAALALADAVVFCNEPERQAFAALGITGTTVLSTGDTLGLASSPAEVDAARSAVRTELKLPTPEYCLFVGGAHDPNTEAAREILALAQAMPDLTFVVAGNCVAKATERNFIATGRASEPLLDMLYRGALAVLVPLRRGTGISVKTFQAASYGKPIISTQIGARGWDLQHEKDVLLAEVADFPAAIRRLRQEPALASKIAAGARRYAEDLDFRNHFLPYAEIINRLVPGRRIPAEPSTSALVLVDNNLSSAVGHHFNYALALQEACATAKVSFRALIRESADGSVVAALGAEGVFKHVRPEGEANPFPVEWHGLRSMYDFLHSNEAFARELEQGLARTAQPFDHIFLPNATPHQILGLALVLHKNPLYRTLRFSLLLRYTTFAALGPIEERKNVQDRSLTEQYTLALDRLFGVDPSLSIRLATDSEALAREFSPIAKRAIEVWPVPHTAAASPPGASVLIPAKPAGKTRVVFLGDARKEKGFELLPGAVRACAADPALAAVEFVIQAYVSHPCHQPMAMVIEELRRLGLPQLRLIESALAPEEYQALLESADVVLLPYDSATYQARTSGPFVEAICADKPVIVPSDSWMSAQLGGSPAGETFISGRAPDLARALRTVLLERAQRAGAAAALGRCFREFHNPASFLRHLHCGAKTP